MFLMHKFILNGLDPNVVQVELFADATKDKGLFRQEMKRVSQNGRSAGWL